MSVTVLLWILFSVAVTLTCDPVVAVEAIVPVPEVMEGNTVVLSMFQVTCVVMSCCVALPENVPFAVNVTDEPAVGVFVDAVIWIDCNGPVFTVMSDVAVNPWYVAVIVAVPGGVVRLEAAVTTPVLLTVATV